MQGGTRFAAPAQVSYWHLADVHADRYFGRYRGKNGHTASTREPTRLTRCRHRLAVNAVTHNHRQWRDMLWFSRGRPTMRRRAFIALLGGSAVTWPLVVRAQQAAIPVVGFLSARSPAESAPAVRAFRQGLGEIGYIEGKNIIFEYRWAEGFYERLPALAADLVGRQVAVIAATGGEVSGLAAKAATATIPIVFTAGGDPVALGLVGSLNKPGGNVTGIVIAVGDTASKRLGLLHQLVPNATAIAMLVNPNFPMSSYEARYVQASARSIGLQIRVLSASTTSEIDTAFATLAQERPDALFIGGDPFLLGQRDQLVLLAERNSLATIYPQREYVDAGGLASYGADIPSAYQLAGTYVGRILKGERPAALPVQQPTKLELVINLKTAKALRLTIPPVLLATADEVIE
jgi:putative tryptophan/tyrosine transport system substrate-binding protein